MEAHSGLLTYVIVGIASAVVIVVTIKVLPRLSDLYLNKLIEGDYDEEDK